MKTTLVTAFGEFLTHDANSTQELIARIPKKEGLYTHIFPVGYFARDIIKPLKKYHVKRIIFLGMHSERTQPTFEVVARNQKITLKNPLYRAIVTLYGYVLKWNNKNVRIQKPLPEDKLVILPINKHQPERVTLRTVPPKLKNICVSQDAGNFVCNYAMWVAEHYLLAQNPKAEFYFIHLPRTLTAQQRKELLRFIRGKA